MIFVYNPYLTKYKTQRKRRENDKIGKINFNTCWSVLPGHSFRTKEIGRCPTSDTTISIVL